MNNVTKVEEEFRKSLSRLTQCEGAVLAVSGGPDSMAMLALCIKERDEGRLPFPIVCATFDHGLREESKEEVAGVARYCKEHGVTFEAAFGDLRHTMPKGESVESYARQVRYRFLEHEKTANHCTHIFTAHNADDNFETVLLNLVRGCGTDGLCGISRLRKDNNTFRPLLSISKQDLTGYCDHYGIPYYIDSSNSDTVYRRNFIRNRIVPLFKELNPSVLDAAARLCSAAEEDRECFDGLTDEAYERVRSDEGLSLTALTEYRPAIQTRLLRRFVKEITGESPTFADTESLRELVADGQTSDSREVNGSTFIRTYTCLCEADTETGEPIAFDAFIPGDGPNALPMGSLILTAGTDYNGQPDCFKAIPLPDTLVRPRQEGDYIRTSKGGGKLIKKLYIDKKIPRKQRLLLPILTLGDEIVWAASIGTAKEFIPQKGDNYIKAEYIPNRREK